MATFCFQLFQFNRRSLLPCCKVSCCLDFKLFSHHYKTLFWWTDLPVSWTDTRPTVPLPQITRNSLYYMLSWRLLEHYELRVMVVCTVVNISNCCYRGTWSGCCNGCWCRVRHPFTTWTSQRLNYWAAGGRRFLSRVKIVLEKPQLLSLHPSRHCLLTFNN